MKSDSAIFNLLEEEKDRQSNGIELIASENFTSPEVMEACGSILTNKYAEGYPGKRYYGGCEVVDKVELIAIERAKVLFGAAYANVQPHSGSQANTAVFHAFLKPGDKILGFDLSHGGYINGGWLMKFDNNLFVELASTYFQGDIYYGVDDWMWCEYTNYNIGLGYYLD